MLSPSSSTDMDNRLPQLPVHTQQATGTTAKRQRQEDEGCEKRLKAVDVTLKKLQDQFKLTLAHELPEEFEQPYEASIIKTKLTKDHYVSISGYENSRYLACALSVICDLGYKRCVEITTPAELKHIDPEEVDLVLYNEPFSISMTDPRKKRDLFGVFGALVRASTTSRDNKSRIDVVVVTDKMKLKQNSDYSYDYDSHPIFKGMVVLGQPNREETPVAKDEGYEKRLKTVDVTLKKLQDQFKLTLAHELPEEFEQPYEASIIKAKLTQDHYVSISGYENSRYLVCALSVICDLGYKRCVEITKAEDWKHIDPDEVDLVLYNEPFSISMTDPRKKRDIFGVFDALVRASTTSREKKARTDVVVVTDKIKLKENSDYSYDYDSHPIFKGMVVLGQSNIEETPVAQGDIFSRSTQSKKNLIAISDVFIQQRKSDSVDPGLLVSAKKILQHNKAVVITGPKGCGKTTFAASLASSLYERNQCVVLAESSAWNNVKLDQVSAIIIDEFAGKFNYNAGLAETWLNRFDLIHAAVSTGKLNVIITCEATRFDKVVRKNKHPLLNQFIKLPKRAVGTPAKEPASDNDQDVTKRCLKRIRSLKKGTLPGKKLLDDICFAFGRKSEILADFCPKICDKIKASDENILHVWATYTLKDKNKITFVVIVRKNIRLKKTVPYTCKTRVVNEYSLEAKAVKDSDKFPLDGHDLQRLTTSINSHSTELMNRHKYLSVISGSSVRSRRYGIDSANKVEIVKETCIVLYVHTKYYIPIEEEPFAKCYDGVPVDVREGEFVPYGLATEHHSSLKHGCQIGSSPDRPPNSNSMRVGSLGCFVDHPEYNLCGLTCAHVLLFPWGLEEVKKDDQATLRWPCFKPHDKVYQPAGSGNAIGQLVQVIYNEGGNHSCGMEVALFQIDDRPPVSGNFPTMGNAGDGEEMIFDSGKSCGFSHIGAGEAIKFGPVTDKTVGKFELEAMTNSVKTISHYWNVEQFRITLHNQLCVKATDSIGQPVPFAAEGDSGSLVFIKDSSGELASVGIVEGGTSFGATIVSPIKPILQKLGVQSIKSFEKENILQKLNNIQNVIESIVSTQEDLKTTIVNEIAGLIKGRPGGNG